jgi:hypothetical protein
LQNVSGEENASADFLIVAFQPTDQRHNLNAASVRKTLAIAVFES